MSPPIRWITLSAVLGLATVARPALGSEPQAIYGGAQVQPCGWPTTVSLGGCTGTLVHPELVVFAAHCLEGGSGPASATFGDNDAYPAFEVGTHSCKSDPKYSSSSGHDVAYCKLSKAVTSVPIVPILMGCETSVLVPGVEVVAVGFGQANDGLGWGPKREVTMKLNSIQGGEAFIGGSGKDTCYGDSGGPVFTRLADGSWRVFGITSYGEYCGGGGYYSMMHSAIDWLEQSSGLDLTPCHAQGAWAPTPGCGKFPLEPNTGGSSWNQGCANGKLSGPSTACGAAYDGSSAAGGSGGTGAGGTSSGGAGSSGAGGTGLGSSGGAGGGDEGGSGGEAPECDQGGDCVERCTCLTGNAALCAEACEPYGAVPSSTSGGAPNGAAADDDNAPVTGGCAVAGRSSLGSWLLLMFLSVLAFRRRVREPSVSELSASALELCETPCDDPTVKRAPSFLPTEEDSSYRSWDETRRRPFQSAPVLERTFDTPPRLVLPRLPPVPRPPTFLPPLAPLPLPSPRPRLSSLPPPVAMDTPQPILLAHPKRTSAPSWTDSCRTTRPLSRSLAAMRSELRQRRGAIGAGVLAGIALFTLFIAWLRAPATAAAPEPGPELFVTVAGRGARPMGDLGVFVDGVLRCSASPCRVSSVGAGMHFVSASAEGFTPSAPRVVSLRDKEPTALHLELEPLAEASSAKPAALLEPAGAAVSTQSLGALPTLPARKPAAPFVPPDPNAGSAELNLNSIPIASVVLDGRPLGPTPRLGVRVSPGDHSVVFIHPEHGRRSLSVHSTAGSRRTVAVRFE